MASTNPFHTAQSTSTPSATASKNNLSAENIFDTPKTSLSYTTTPVSSQPATPTKPTTTRPSTNLRIDSEATHADLEKGHGITVGQAYLSPPLSAACTNASASAGGLKSPLYGPCKEYPVAGGVKECAMWPSRETLRCKARDEKMDRRGSNLYGMSQRWARLSKRRRLLFKILLGLFVIGVAVGIAVGISKAVGGGVWTGQNATQAIDKSS